LVSSYLSALKILSWFAMLPCSSSRGIRPASNLLWLSFPLSSLNTCLLIQRSLLLQRLLRWILSNTLTLTLTLILILTLTPVITLSSGIGRSHIFTTQDEIPPVNSPSTSQKIFSKGKHQMKRPIPLRMHLHHPLYQASHITIRHL